MKIESRIGKVQADQEKVFTLLADFRNLNNYIPSEKVSDFQATIDSCTFTVEPIGKFGMQIIEREPNNLIKIANDKAVPFNFNMWIQLKEVGALDTRVKITLKAELNPMLNLVAKNPLKKFVETLIDKIELIR